MLKHARIYFLVLILLPILVTPPAMAREGFGALKKTALITRIKAPEVFLPGNRLAVRVNQTDPNFQSAAERIAQTVEADLLNADPRFTAASSAPDMVVEISVLQSAGDRQTSTREVTKSKVVGKDAEGKARYSYYQDTVTDYHFSYAFEATYRVDDVRNGDSRTLHADSFSHSFSEKYTEGNTLPTEQSMQDDALAAAAKFIVAKLAPTHQAFQALIPKGSFKDLVALAENRHWSRYLQAVPRVPRVKKAEDEAYREYAMGLAYEGLGYNAETADQTLRYLEQALVHYNRAIEIKPSEKYFLEAYEGFGIPVPIIGKIGTSRLALAPLDRVRTSMLSYEEIKKFQEELGTGSLTAGSKSLDGHAGASQEAASGLNNQQVIEMVRAELSQDIIITTITSCEEHDFDISPDGLIKLSRAGVDPAIIRAVQEKAHP